MNKTLMRFHKRFGPVVYFNVVLLCHSMYHLQYLNSGLKTCVYLLLGPLVEAVEGMYLHMYLSKHWKK